MAQGLDDAASTQAQAALNVVIEHAQEDDVDALGAISGAAFEDDTHTQLKAQFQGANSHADGMSEAIKGWMAHPKVDVLVAKDADSGRVLGSICWGRRGYEGDVDLPMDKPTEPEGRDGPKTIELLETLSSHAMQAFAYKIMPEGCRCRYIMAVTIDPAYQGRGIGTKLIRWGTDKADKEGAYCWVSSSMGAVRAYEKLGFREVGKFEADLDEYAEGKPRPGKDASWGRYAWPYMKREPQA